MRRTAMLGTLLLLSACDDEGRYGGQGHAMHTFFAFEGEQVVTQWTFVRADTEAERDLVATLNQNYQEVDDGQTRIFTIDYERVCPEDEEEGQADAQHGNEGSDCEDEPAALSSVRWSSNGTHGTRVHGYVFEGDEVSLDPPLELTPGRMSAGDQVHTETDGASWSSEFAALVDCPAPWWEAEPPSCIRLEVSDGGAGRPLAGTYWVAPSFNVVSFQHDHDDATWELIHAVVE